MSANFCLLFVLWSDIRASLCTVDMRVVFVAALIRLLVQVLPDDENVTPSVDQAGMFNFAGGEATAPAAAAAAPQQGMESSQGTSFNFGGL